MGNTRQTKGRSRTGCKQCRTNRKKCDEVRPTCGRCAVRHIACEFDRPLGVRLGNRRRSSVMSPESPRPQSSPEYTSSVPGVSPLLELTTPMGGGVDPGTDLPNDYDPFHDLLQDLFGSSVPDMSASMSLIFGPGGQSELAGLASENPTHFQTVHSPNVEPRDVQRRFNAPMDPRAALQASISPAIVATLSDIDARLFYHYIDVQATISIGLETDDNPLTKHFIPIALSSALAGASEDNPAFHALKATAATNRANLMDRTGTDGSRAFREIAQVSRKAAYGLLAARIEGLATAPPAEREQFAGALAILVSLAVIDGNTRLLPRLFEAYSACLPSMSLTPREEFCIMATSLWQTWYNFTLSMCLDQPPLPPLYESLPYVPHCPDVDRIFAVAPRLAVEHMRVYRLIRDYRAAGPAEALSAQLEADELITRYEVAVEATDRIAIGRIMHYAALRVLLLREIFQAPRDDVHIREAVAHALSVLPNVKWGTEAGLLIPLVILSAAALDRERRQFRTFMLRLCWKGSAGPRAALETLDSVIQGADWKQALARTGSVVLV